MTKDAYAKPLSTLQTYVSQVLRGLSTSPAIFTHLGTDRAGLMRCLEGQFEAGMTWENRGLSGWIVGFHEAPRSWPLADVTRAFDVSNLRPIWLSHKARIAALPEGERDAARAARAAIVRAGCLTENMSPSRLASTREVKRRYGVSVAGRTVGRVENAKPLRKLGNRLRDRIRVAIMGKSKRGSAVTDLGCTIDECRAQLEALFTEGMTWETYGLSGWHIDHIRPLRSFDLEDRDQFLAAVNYKNLQPLWAKDNLTKSGKWA